MVTFRVQATRIRSIDRSPHILEALLFMGRQQVLIGIPDESTTRQTGNITNAALAALHERGFSLPKWEVYQAYAKRFGRLTRKADNLQALRAHLYASGDPLFHVPPRPFLQPAIEANLDLLVNEQSKAVKQAFQGQKQNIIPALQRVGMLAQNLVKAWFTDPRNGWAPNSPLIAKLKGSDKPLIDTGALRNAIRYVVRDKQA